MTNKKSLITLFLVIGLVFSGMVILTGCSCSCKKEPVEEPVNEPDPIVQQDNEINLIANDKEYDGEAYAPFASALSNTDVIFEYKAKDADDSEYSMVAPKNVGEYVCKAYVAETEQYKACEVTDEFFITAKTITANWEMNDLVYNKETKIPLITLNGVVDGDDVHITSMLTSGSSVNVGDATYRISIDNSNYLLDDAYATRTFTITPKELGVTWNNPASLEYNTQAKIPTVKFEGVAEGDDLDFTGFVKSGYNYEVGEFTYTFTINNSNYTVKESDREKSFTITPKEIVVSWNVPDLTYNKQPKIVTAEIFDGVYASDVCYLNVNLKEGSNNVNVGTFTYTASITNPNYKLKAEDLEKSWTITPCEVSVSWETPNSTYAVYNKEEKKAIATITSGVIDGDTCSVSSVLKEGSDNVNAGECTYVAILSNSNYKVETGKEEVTFTITPKSLTLDWNAPAGTYDGTAKMPTLTIITSLYDGDECHAIATLKEGDDNVNAGQFTVYASTDNPNYEFKYDNQRTFTISKAYYPMFNGRYHRPGSDSYYVPNLEVGETIVFEIYFTNPANAVTIEGDISFVIYSDSVIQPTGDATVNGNLVTITKCGYFYVQGRIAESRNYYAATTNGVQRVEVAGREPVEGVDYTLPTNLTATVGQKLSEIALPTEFIWVYPNTTISTSGTQSYMAVFIPQGDDAILTARKTVYIQITVSEANLE